MNHLEAHLAAQTMGHLSFWHEVRASVALRDLPSGPCIVADVGAGAGQLGTFVTRTYPQASYRFVEPIPSLADLLAKTFGEQSRLDGIENVGDADIVTLLDVIEHIEDDRGFLQEVVENMRPGAQLVVSVPALPVLWSAWDVELGHFRRYTRASLAATMAELDLGESTNTYLFPELLPPALFRRMVGGRVGSGSGQEIAEYPELPRWVDRSLWFVSSATARLRSIWPAGTSLMFVARKPLARDARERSAS